MAERRKLGNGAEMWLAQGWSKLPKYGAERSVCFRHVFESATWIFDIFMTREIVFESQLTTHKAAENVKISSRPAELRSIHHSGYASRNSFIVFIRWLNHHLVFNS